MPYLVVIYGAPLSGKSTLASELAGSMGGKTAIVSTDQLTSGAIAVSDNDASAELDMAHVQLRLLVANYLKNRYHVVVEGPFFFERDGVLYNYEADIDQLVALMRNLISRAMVVRLQAPAEALVHRAAETEREGELAVAQRIDAAYRMRSGDRFLAFDSASRTPAEIAVAIREALLGSSA